MKIDEYGKLTLQISIDFDTLILEVEEWILQALNGAGCALTELSNDQHFTATCENMPIWRHRILSVFFMTATG